MMDSSSYWRQLIRLNEAARCSLLQRAGEFIAAGCRIQESHGRFDTRHPRLYHPREMQTRRNSTFSKPWRLSTRFKTMILAVLLAGIIAVLLVFARPRRRPKPTDTATPPRIVSLLPQASDILESMGCGDHLVGITTIDEDPRVANLPRAGDYMTTDWETIATLHPQWIITHYGPGRTPAGFTQHADAIGAQQLNLLTETLNGPDKTSTIYYAIEALGKACNEPEKAAVASARLRDRLASIHHHVANQPSVSALIIIGAQGTMAAGKDSYLSELLDIAGGSNVAADLNARYPSLDREQLIALRPEVILQLLPDASPQVKAQAAGFWDALPEIPAVKNHRVQQLTEWYEMLPGYHVGDVAQQFADALHPSAVKN
ncbi:MAG TPA: helical backbone metal receptor [Tepidisphaeraceae bacterium]|nr:helical backbone metal receptor [Tepidisphaeraceae bacterium]